MSAAMNGFHWSATSFFVGVSATIDLSTIVTSVLLWRRNAHSWFYAWLAAVTTAHVLDLTSRSVSDVLTRTDKVGPDGQFIYRPLTAGTLAINLFCVTFAWIGAVGFVTLNASRFFIAASSRMPKFAKVVVAITGLSVTLNSVNNLLYYISFVGAYRNGTESTSESLLEAMDHMFSAWSIFDALVNCMISVAFVAFLKSMGGQGIRKGFSEMLANVTWLLGFECALMIGANVFVQVAPNLDPAWISIYVCESLRLRIFCLFLHTLNRMLRQKVATELPSSANRDRERDQFLSSSHRQDLSYTAISMPGPAAGGFSSASQSLTWQGGSTATSSSSGVLAI